MEACRKLRVMVVALAPVAGALGLDFRPVKRGKDVGCSSQGVKNRVQETV